MAPSIKPPLITIYNGTAHYSTLAASREDETDPKVFTSKVRNSDALRHESEDFTATYVSDHHSLFGSWIWELIAIAVSCGSLVAIIAVLKTSDGKPQTAWSLTALSINTVVAILGTLSRTSLAFAVSACIGQQKWNWLHKSPDHLVAFERFDEASRGPWGASRLFFWLKMRHWATLGALVIVGSVAFDPFIQAVLSTRGQLDNKASDTHTTIGQAYSLDSGTLIDRTALASSYQPNPSLGFFPNKRFYSIQPDFGIVSSIYEGFRNVSALQDDTLDHTCRTGNCTWPMFTSAAVCSSCNDVSAALVQKAAKGDLVQLNVITKVAPYTTFSLPYANISNYNGLASKGIDSIHSISSAGTTLMAMNITLEAKRTISFQDSKVMLLSFLVIKASDDWIDSLTPWEKSKPKATECALSLCANIYQSTVRNGLLEETATRSWSQRSAESWRAQHFNTTMAKQMEAWYESHGSPLFDDDYERSDLELTIPDDEKDIPVNVTRRFNVTQAFILSTITAFLDLQGGGRNIVQRKFSMIDNDYPILQPLWNSTDLNATFARVARSMTNQLRNSSPHPQIGTVQEWVIHVQVDWKFLAFPAVILSAGILYVVLSILESARLKLPTWKERILPTLLHGLDEEAQALLREEQSDSRSIEKASKSKVHFDGDRLRLVGS